MMHCMNTDVIDVFALLIKVVMTYFSFIFNNKKTFDFNEFELPQCVVFAMYTLPKRVLI